MNKKYSYGIFGERVIRLISGIIFMAMYARKLNTEIFGQQLLLFYYFGIFSFLIGLGRDADIQVKIQLSAKDVKSLIGLMVGTRAIASPVFFCIILIILLINKSSPETIFLAGIIIVISAVFNIADFCDISLAASNNLKKLLFMRFFSLFIGLLIKYLYYLNIENGDHLYIVLIIDFMIGSVLYIITGWLRCKSLAYIISDLWVNKKKYTYEFFSTILSVLQSKIDVLLGPIFFNRSDFGLYLVGARVADAFCALLNNFATVSVAEVMPFFSSNRKLFYKKIFAWLKWVILVCGLISIVFYFLGGGALALIFGENYEKSSTLTALLVFSGTLGQVAVILGKIIIANNGYVQRIIRIGLSLLVTILLIALIGNFGYIAWLAIAALVGQLVVAISSLIVVLRYKNEVK